MKIGIDGRLWAESGVGRYIRNLVLHLSKIDSENEYYLLLLKKNLDQNLPKNFHKIEADIPWYSFVCWSFDFNFPCMVLVKIYKWHS